MKTSWFCLFHVLIYPKHLEHQLGLGKYLPNEPNGWMINWIFKTPFYCRALQKHPETSIGAEYIHREATLQ